MTDILYGTIKYLAVSLAILLSSYFIGGRRNPQSAEQQARTQFTKKIILLNRKFSVFNY
jgi:hypothetical protein